MLFITRKRFEEEVQRRIEEQRTIDYIHERISGTYEAIRDTDKEVVELKHRFDELEALVKSGGVVKENTCDDEFFVEPPVGNVIPK